MSINSALACGLAGAATVSFLNEAVRRLTPELAPRMEVLGMRAAKAGFEAAGKEVPPRRDLIRMTFGAEVIANSAYYSLVGFAKPNDAIAVGAALGLAAGAGAIWLPGPMGLGEEPSSRTMATKAMTIGWYLAGGLAAGLLAAAIGRRNKKV